MAQAITSDEFAARRRHMVDSQLRTCDVTDQAVLAAFAEAPRERFVLPAMASLAYLDRDVPALGASRPPVADAYGFGQVDPGGECAARRKSARCRRRVGL